MHSVSATPFAIYYLAEQPLVVLRVLSGEQDPGLHGEAPTHA